MIVVAQLIFYPWISLSGWHLLRLGQTFFFIAYIADFGDFYNGY